MRLMSSPRRAGALVAVCAAAGLAAAFLNTTRAAGGPLIDSGLAASPPSVQDPVIARSRYIAIDFDALPVPSRRQLLARERSFPLELFPDLSVPVVLDRLESNAAGVTWSGRADNVLLSSVTLAYGNGLLAGSVILPTGTYRIRPAPPDERRARSLPGRELHIVSQINVDALPREGDPVEVELAPADPRAEVGPMADTGEFVDLMVLYTTLAMNAEGGPAEIENLINLGVS